MTLSGRSALWQSALCLFLMAVVVLAESCTGLDLFIQRHWYDASRGLWAVDPAVHQTWRWLFYDGAKRFVAVVGALSLALAAWGCASGRSALFRAGLLMALSCAATPLLVSALKAVTGIYCPRQLEIFGGHAPYGHLLSPAFGASGGRCFPGGHASGGFALTMLFFCLPGRGARGAALVVTLGIGWTMGLYQMMRGEHFLSHTVMSMLLAWQMNVLLVLLVDRAFLPAWKKRRDRRAGAAEHDG